MLIRKTRQLFKIQRLLKARGRYLHEEYANEMNELIKRI